jgi:dihydrofolate reductase
MRKIRGAAFVSLDGIMQAPGGPTEDPTGGFQYGGWLPAFFDEAVGRRIERLFSREFDLLLGRRTYDIFAAYWPVADDDQKDIRDPFNRSTKYVVTSRRQPLSWENSYRLPDLDALAAVKKEVGPDLVIQGSSTLYPQLLAAGLLDELTLMTFPLVLGGWPRSAREAMNRREICGHHISSARTPSGIQRPSLPGVNKPFRCVGAVTS